MTERLPWFTLECENREPDLSAARTCRLLAQLKAEDRDDYWLAEVDPPFLGQHFGLGAVDISDIVIATKLKGFSLLDSEAATAPVYVARILDRNVIATRTLKPDQAELILWCIARPLRSS
jgi:hypothetical protein